MIQICMSGHGLIIATEDFNFPGKLKIPYLFITIFWYKDKKTN